MTEEALSQAGHTWVTVLTDRTADYSFRPEADSLLLVGPRLLDCCADRAPGRPPLEDNLGGGIPGGIAEAIRRRPSSPCASWLAKAERSILKR